MTNLKAISARLPLIFLFIISFTIYVFTSPRTIFLGDNAEFITAGATLGIPHPPGFPVYVMFAKLFSFLPIDGVVLRINLLSALSASLTLVFLYMIMTRLIRSCFPEIPDLFSRWIAGAGLFILAFSKIFWEQAITAEAYSLNVLFLSVVLFLFIKFLESNRKKWIYLFAFIFGLGLGVHTMMVLFLPVFFLTIIIRSDLRKLKVLTLIFVFLILGFSVFLYLPLRSAMDPVLDWGNTGAGLENFVNHITRSSYDDFGVGPSISDKGLYLVSAFQNIFDQFSVLLLFGFFGAGLLLKRNQNLFFLLFGILLLNILGIVLLRDVKFSFSGEFFYSTYYTPAYAMTAIFTILGIAELPRYILKPVKAGSRTVAWLIIVLMVLPSGLFLFSNFQKNNLLDFKFVENYSAQMLERLDPNAVMILSTEGQETDSMIFSLLYQQSVKKLRQDVTIISPANVFPSAYDYKDRLLKIYGEENISDQRNGLLDFVLTDSEFENDSIYTSFIIPDSYENKGEKSVSNGFLYKVTSSSNLSDLPASAPFAISENDEKILLDSYPGRDFLAYYYLAQAALLVRNKNFEESQQFYIKAINTDNDVGGVDIVSFQRLRGEYLNRL
ncbi:MAG: hypothetical protein COT91_03200 [Candidatus Doudnabacteria bacterium CG10_big_fil_rev_8_21_14_0_10_41_10]|uniref:DUF2723 domain-containing protein n=1 Tax=Candidatus Doudnabacteria bacterium CG10_big_fil_rev_8_21_14_0_10_41_10 TaxID=1974551 RepID=A0A2H0VD85_9BACT|nr:MAG: hypothetical protein COT91_03200 [Candidatus Doudnabacteria bacterium CG10_big_fil_rev_8_21_14_0_10_41_10]